MKFEELALRDSGATLVCFGRRIVECATKPQQQLVDLRLGEIGLITPPKGLNVFAVKAMNSDIPMGVIFRGVAWFIVCEALVEALIIAFPQIALFLPSTMQ